MRYRKVINKTIDDMEGGISAAVAINAVIAVNANETGASHISSKQRIRIVRRGTKTQIREEEVEVRTTTPKP